jgi:plasmid stabilization system protein ParE
LKILWSPLAIKKVGDQAANIALDKPMVAEQWTDDIFAAVARLSELPQSGKMVPEIGRKDTREISYGNYRIIYKVTTEVIFILTVRHCRQLLTEHDLEN